MNTFVDFLNSLHGVKGDGLGALAEHQIQSPYAAQCRVPRKIGKNIIENLYSGEKTAYVITGHAGDGKTSILSQILQETGLTREGELLQEAQLCQSGDISLYYVKDMSEIAPDKRVEYLRKALEAPGKGSSSILISNTGPLLETFEKVLEEDEIAAGNDYNETIRKENQTTLLEQLDENSDGEIQIGQYELALINIARVNNVGFAKQYIDKVVADDLWRPCQECTHKDECAIHCNYLSIKDNKKSVTAFLDSYYRYLYENDQRLTIRKIQAQIAFALTGGLTCKKHSAYKKTSRFKYNFANLFFGYNGLKKYPDALEILAISDLYRANLDGIALPEDYNMFVKNEIIGFSQNIRDIIESDILPKIKMANMQEDEESVKVSAEARKALRRFYLMYGQMNDHQRERVQDCLFGDGFTSYMKMLTVPKLPDAQRRPARDAVFAALYARNTGFLPTNTSTLPLTLHRNDGVFQSVLLVLGEASKSDFSIRQKKVQSSYEDEDGLSKVVLKFAGNEFEISLPLFLYFMQLKDGRITSNCNPALTHNLMKLETRLNAAYHSEEEDDTEIKLLLNTSMGQESKTIYIEDDGIELG